MGAVMVIGEEVVVSGYAMAGALVKAADGGEQVRSAWSAEAAGRRGRRS